MADQSRSSDSSDSDSGSASEIEVKPQCHTASKSSGNVFKNDGSFMEMFKKMQDERNKKDSKYFDTPPVPNKMEPEDSITSAGTSHEETDPATSQKTKKPSVMSFVSISNFLNLNNVVGKCY